MTAMAAKTADGTVNAVPDPHVLLACPHESAAEITALGGVDSVRNPAGDL